MAIFKNHKVLIFDENIFMGRLLYTILSAFDIGQITICHTWKEAQYYLSQMKFDCVFCDWSRWPDPTPECLNYIRFSGEAADSTMPVIICSGQTSIVQILECRNLGCTEFVVKPIAPSHVFDKLYSALYQPREFIASDAFTGPDRRRNRDKFAGIEKRRDMGLAQREIDKFLEGDDASSS